MSFPCKTVHVIAGPNGAGKSTFVENYLNRYVDCDEFLNADLIAKGLSPFAPERMAIKASEIFLERLDNLERGNVSFALETTLAGLSYRRRIAKWKELGFRVCLFFLWLPSDLIAMERVAIRVRQGGHNIPGSDIQRRYRRGLDNLMTIYLPLVDDAWILNGAVAPPEIIWRRVERNEQTFDEALWGSLNNTGRGRSMIRENNSDSERSADERVAAACRDSGEQVILRAEQTGTSVVIWRDGKIVHLTAAEARAESLRKKTRND